MRFIFYYIFLRWFFRITLCAQQDPIETLFINIEGNFSRLLEDLEEAVERMERRLEELEQSGEQSGAGVQRGAAVAGAAFGLAAGAAAKLLDIVVNLAVAIPQFFAQLGREAVQANAQFETFATQFETLLGSGSLAQDRLEELARFGVETPFELPEIVEASRLLQTFGGTALATGDSLRMVGDIAASANQPIQDLAFWVGRLYSAMQGGQPFGEASSRLQELGVLSSDTRLQLEAMQKAGADGTAMWKIFSEQVGGPVAGGMERLSNTFQGVMSNLEDFRGNLLRVGGQPFFEEVRESAKQFLDLLNENEGVIANIATGIGELAAGVVRFAREGLGSVNIGGFLEQIQKFVDWLNRVSRSFQAATAVSGQFFEALSPIFNLIKTLLGVALLPVVEGFKALWEVLSRVDEALVTGAQVLALSTAGWKGLFATLAPIGNVISKIGQAIWALATGDFVKAGKLAGEAMAQVKEGLFDVDGGIKAMEDSIRQSAAAIDKWVNPAEKIKEEGQALAEDTKPEDIGMPGPSKVSEMMDSLTNQMIAATENRDEKLSALTEKHAEKVAKIMADANKKRLDIENKFSEDMADLAEDSEEKRLQVIEDTRNELANLAKDTDEKIAERRDEFNRDELRETEDHLREMRRLEENYLMDLTDAVKNRDARAVVDLQRKFAQESQEREEDFQTKRGREDQDFDIELRKTRESEAQRRAEILASQAEELESIQEHETEKALEIEARRDESLEKLRENLNEQLNRENQNYAERQAALDEALRNQLQSIAQNLSDEKDVTEEGAQQILETFNEYFGVGGNIDQLMEGFSKRRRIRADIRVDFESRDETDKGKTPSSPGPVGLPPELVKGAKAFATGGTLLANKPTLALFGENEPEVAQFTPLSQLSNVGSSEPGRMIIEMTGSAPPGIGTSERDQIASILVSALRETGALER